MRFISPGAIVTGIIVVYMALAVAYAGAIPKWNAPDEPSHYNYVKAIAQDWQLPILKEGDYNFDYLEKLKSARFPEGMPIDSIRYESHQPPLYYLLATPIFRITASLPIDSQVLALRLLSTIFGALTILIAYVTLRRMFKGDALVAVAGAAFIASIPMYIAMTAAINNDSLANLLLSAVLFGCVALQDRIGSDYSYVVRHEHIWLGVLLGLALLTKTTSSIAVVLVASAVLAHEVRSPSGNRLRRGVARLVKIYGVALVISAWWFVRNAWVYGNLDIFGLKRHDLVVVGQPLTGQFNLSAAKHLVTVSFQSFWAQFGWMGILVDARIYLLLWTLCLLAGLGFVLFVARVLLRSDALTSCQKCSLGLLALSLALISAGLLLYNLTYIQAQGRYFFPAIVAIAAIFVLGIREIVSERYVGLIFVLLFVGMFLFDAVALVRYILPVLAS